jgi:hypothetical protein
MTTTPAGICDLSLIPVIATPWEHVRNEQFINPEMFAALRDSFPSCPPNRSPTGFSLYSGDDDYQRLLDAQPAWQALFETFHSQRFIDWGIAQFADVWQREGCRVDLSKARYVPYREDRFDKLRDALRNVAHAPHELWVRMDIYQGHVGYRRPIHRDFARRLISMLIYFCDHDDTEMAGGELLLHKNGWNRWSRPAATVTPRENLMVAFPCTSRSFHSVPPIRSMARPRNYIQVHISSSVDIWPHGRN